MSPYRIKKNIPEVKPFRLAKYFAVTSFIVIIAISIPFAVFISQKAKEDLIDNSQKYVREIAENINHQLFINFYFPVLYDYGEIKLSLKSSNGTP